MSEDLLIRHCSPTLAGIKTGNLFSCACPSRKDLTRDLCRLNKKLVPRGIRILPLRVRKGRALIYAYRHNALESDLTDYRRRVLAGAGQRVFRHRLWLPLHWDGAAGGERVRSQRNRS